MLAPAIEAIRAHVEAHYTALPLRWQNEPAPEATTVQSARLPFVEVEIIGGSNALRSFSTPGSRVFVHSGLVRFYIFAPTSTGMADAHATADQLAAFMQRTEFGQAEGRTVRTLDFSSYAGVASSEDGNYAVLMGSVGFEFFYTG